MLGKAKVLTSQEINWGVTTLPIKLLRSQWRFVSVVVSALFLAIGATSLAQADEGVSLFNAGKYSEAKSNLEKEVKAKPNDSNLKYYYAVTLSKLGEDAKA